MIEIRTLKGISFEAIESVFNESFSDYYFPIQFSKEQLEEKFESEQGILELSVGAFQDDKLVGFILHFQNIIDHKKVIYNGGTGVIPNMRGNGLTEKMYAFIIPILKEVEVERCIHEVLTINVPAIKVYERVGFSITRTLDCYAGLLNVPNIDIEYELKPLEQYDWEKMQSFWDYLPTWQNSSMTMNHLKSRNESVGVYDGNNLLGYIIFNPIGYRIYQIAIDKAHRNKGLAKLLLSNIVGEQSEKVSIINQDARMVFMGKLLESCGLKMVTQQYEMEYEL